MNYARLPITALLRGPLLHTPQGCVVLVYFVAYTIAAALVWFLQLPPPIGKTPEVFLTICLAWPFIVFLMFVRDGSPTFVASWPAAAWLILCGALPALFRIYDALRT